MKLAFIIPPVLDNTHDVDRCFGCNYNIYFLPLLPVLYCATVLQQRANRVSITDFAALKKTEKDLRAFIAQDDSDVYVFYTVFLSQQTDLIARRLIREARPGKRFVFFGPQPTYDPGVFLDRDDTFLVRGEPELAMEALVETLDRGGDPSGVQGVSFLADGKVRSTAAAQFIEDIDSLPIPDRSLLDHTPYCNPKLRKLPHTAALTSRGCFGQCWYCVPNSLSYARELEYKKGHGRKPPGRLHSAQRVIEEFRQIKMGGFGSVSIIDDQFIWEEGRTLAICEGIKDLGLEWSCLCRPEKINDRVAESMARAGCAYVDLGTESFDEGVLQAINKQMSPADTELAVKSLRRHGIEVEINILLGATPKETKASIEKTISEVRRLDADYVLFSIANPFPGTEFYAAAKKEGWLYFGEYVPTDPARDSIISYPHLTKRQLERLCATAYLTYYFHPRYVFRQILKLKGWRDFVNKFLAAAAFLKKNFLSRPKA